MSTTRRRSASLPANFLATSLDCKLEREYVRIAKNAEGAFGTVYKAFSKSTSQIVAMKHVPYKGKLQEREPLLLNELSHPSIVSLVDAYVTTTTSTEDISLGVDELVIVMEYVPMTLCDLLTKGPVDIDIVRICMHDLASALHYMQIRNICHRDIKINNLLWDPRTRRLKLGDFGSAKRMDQLGPHDTGAGHLTYRAPECILNNTAFTTTADLWSLGCVLAELLLGWPLFHVHGNPTSEKVFSQWLLIVRILGQPSHNELCDMSPLFERRLHCIPRPPVKWTRVFFGTPPPEAVDLVSKLLVYSPLERLTPTQVLAHPFLTSDSNAKSVPS